MLLLGSAWPASCWFESVWPVAAFGVDEVLAEDFAGCEFGDGDRGVVDEHEDRFASVFCSDSEVMHFPSPTQ